VKELANLVLSFASLLVIQLGLQSRPKLNENAREETEAQWGEFLSSVDQVRVCQQFKLTYSVQGSRIFRRRRAAKDW